MSSLGLGGSGIPPRGGCLAMTVIYLAVSVLGGLAMIGLMWLATSGR